MQNFSRYFWRFMESRGKVIMKPYKCVICEGTGKVVGGFYDGNPNPVCAREECKACSGKGILWGSDFSIDVQAPDSVPWVNPLDPLDGNTTFPPYAITWSSANMGPHTDDDKRRTQDKLIANCFLGDIT